MSLQYDFSKIKDAHALHNIGDDAFPTGSPEDLEGGRQWAITEAIIFRMINVGMGGITKKNYEKFFVRLNMVEAVYGCLLVRWEGVRKIELPITLADVKRRIGLSTNVSTETDAAFKKKLINALEMESQRTMRKQASAMADSESKV